MSNVSARKQRIRLDKLESNMNSCIELNGRQHKMLTTLNETVELQNYRIETLLRSRQEDDSWWMDHTDRECRKSYISGMLCGAWVLLIAFIVISLVI